MAIAAALPCTSGANPPPQWTPIGPAPLQIDPLAGGGFNYNGLFEGAGPDAGPVSSIAISPAGTTDDTMFIGTVGGGVWKTTDGAANWQPLTDALPSSSIGSVTLDAADPAVVYAGTGYPDGSTKAVGLYRSADAGATWQQRGAATLAGRVIFRMVSTAANTLLVATDCGLYRSTDGGQSFGAGPVLGSNASCDDSVAAGHAFDPASACPAESCVTDLRVDTSNATTVYAGLWGQGLYRSTDGGATFPTNLFNNSGAPAAPYTRIALAQSTVPNGATLYASVGSTTSFGYKGLFKSTDGGSSWTRPIGADAAAIDANYDKTGDRRKVAFMRNDGADYEIWVRDSDGTEHQLTNNAGDDYDPEISRDGTKVAFSTNRDGNFEIYTMDIDGSNQTRQTNNAALDEYPTWSPDGTAIAFDTDRNGNKDVYYHDAQGDHALETGSANQWRPAWSHTFELAFQTNVDGNDNVYVDRLDGNPPAQITANSAPDTNPSWSPDGTRLAYESTRDDANGDIYIVSTTGDGSVFKRITTSATSVDIDPSWSPDGTEIAFTTNRNGNNDVFRTKADGSGSATALANGANAEIEPSWEPAADANLCRCDRALNVGVDPQDANRVYLGFDEVFASSDGGSTFAPAGRSAVPWEPHTLAFSPPSHFAGTPTRVWAGTDGGIATSANGGSSWVNLNHGLATSILRSIDIGRGSGANNGYTYAGVDSGGTIERRPAFAGLEWHLGIAGESGPVAVAPDDPTTAYGSHNHAFMRTTDAGASWSEDSTIFAGAIAVDPSNPATVYVANADGFGTPNLRRSVNSGVAFTSMHNFAATVWSVSVAPSNPDVVWLALGDGTVARTANASAGAGATWDITSVRAVPPAGVRPAVTADPTDATAAVVAYADMCGNGCAAGARTKHVFRTVDSGQHWTDVSGIDGGAHNLADEPVHAIAIDPSVTPHRLIAGTDSGVFSSTDNGANWSPLGAGLPIVPVRSLALDPPLLRVGTSGRGAWQLTIPALGVPGAPANVVATAEDGAATVSWTPPADDGNSAITGYVITPSLGPEMLVGDITSAQVTGLSNGTAYTFRVAARNAVGTGPQSAASNSVTPAAAGGGQTEAPPPSVSDPGTSTQPTSSTPTPTPTPSAACKVPRLKGTTLAKAKKLIAKAHCKLGKVVRKRAPKGKRGRVLTQSPTAGKRVRAGTKVKLTVGR